MSYKVDVSHLEREGEVSVTQQLVDRFAAAIEAGELAPGEKLPATRALAADAGVNHLTAARVYRRLAELGYVSATVGRGTFVRALAPAGADQHGDDWQAYVLPEWQPSYSEEVLADAFAMAGEPEVISLATGWPSPSFYPTEQIARMSAEVFAEEGGKALGYLPADGLPALREEVARRGRKVGFAEGPDEVLITSGAQQGIDLVARALLEPGDVVAVESPTYVGLLSALRGTGARVIGVPVDDDGMDVDALESLLARHELKLCALQSSCQNPTGRDLSEERRRRLAALATERNLFVIEDGVYADLRFEGERRRPLRQLAPSHVLYLDSVSKTVGGGLRIGWIAARGPVRERLSMLKLETDLHSATLPQYVVARYLASGEYDQHVADTVPHYRERRDALLQALERHLAGEVRAGVPLGGHHVWATLERPVDERALYSEAVRQGVTFTPGAAVLPERRTGASIRLSFSLLEPAELDEGVRRLAVALREVRRRARAGVAITMS
jgi:2-aminoadipate transaminase